MLTKDQKRLLRADLFKYLDGLVTAPIAYKLYEKGVLSYILKEQKIKISTLTKSFSANEGYLHVALRVLASQGWFDMSVNNDSDEIQYQVNENSAIAIKYIPFYEDVISLLHFSGKFHSRKFEKKPFELLHDIFQKFKTLSSDAKNISENEQQIYQQILSHIEGNILAPSIVRLGMSGMFHKYFMEASFRPEEFHKDGMSFGQLLDMFSYFDWFTKKNDTYSFTDKGLFFAKRASAFGVTVSYLPMFRKMEDLLFGKADILWDIPNGSPESHVDREMNVWGSGGAHGTYFKKVDEIIIDLFNKPIEEQPKGIVDMGCGNGAYLQHLYEVIEQRTMRGTMLESHPLFLVGADYNQAALKVTRANLIAADIWAKVIWGDIGRPDLLAKDLQDDYGIQLSDLLNVRTFLDHNRIWAEPEQISVMENSQSTGAFAFRGRRLPNNLVEQNLKEHLLRWSPFVKKFGLLVIELHTISPGLTSKHLGKTAATAYDATHGFSDQYIVEIEVFNKIAAESGLFPSTEHFARFPDADTATVSINLLKGKDLKS